MASHVFRASSAKEFPPLQYAQRNGESMLRWLAPSPTPTLRPCTAARTCPPLVRLKSQTPMRKLTDEPSDSCQSLVKAELAAPTAQRGTRFRPAHGPGRQYEGRCATGLNSVFRFIMGPVEGCGLPLLLLEVTDQSRANPLSSRRLRYQYSSPPLARVAFAFSTLDEALQTPRPGALGSKLL